MPDEFAVGVVDRDDDAVFIGQPHAVHGIFPDGAEEHFGTLQGRLRRAPLGDVADVQQQRGFAVVFNPAGAHLDGNDTAIGGQAFALDPGQFPVRQFLKIARGRLRAAPAAPNLPAHSCRSTVRASCRAARTPAKFTSSTVPSKSSTKMASGEFSNKSWKRCSLSRNSSSARTRSSAPPHWSASVWSMSRSRLRVGTGLMVLDQQHADDCARLCGRGRAWWRRHIRRLRWPTTVPRRVSITRRIRALAVLGCGDGGISTRWPSTVVMFKQRKNLVASRRNTNPAQNQSHLNSASAASQMIIAASAAVVAELNRWLNLEKTLLRCSTRRRSVTSVAMRQRGKTAVESHRAPDDFHINQAAVLAPMPPDQSLAGGIRGDGLLQAVFFRRADVRNGHGQKFLARITVMPDGRLVDLQKFLRFQIEYPHRIGIAVEKQAVLLFAVAQILLRPPAVGHVAAIGHDAARSPGRPAGCCRPVPAAAIRRPGLCSATGF